MKYVMLITRPKVDDQTMTMEFNDKATAAEFAASMVMIESIMEPDFAVISTESSTDELLITLSTGIIHIYPKGH